MTTNASPDPRAVDMALTRKFLLDYPRDAALKIEALAPREVAAVLSLQPVYVLLSLWRYLTPNVAAEILVCLPEGHSRQLLSELPPLDSVRMIGQLDDESRDALLKTLDESIRRELAELMSYPESSAGRLMDTRALVFRDSMTISETLEILRKRQLKTARSVFLVDTEGRLSAKVHLQDIAIADPGTSLGAIAKPVTAVVAGTAGKEEISELFEKHQLLDLPVVDIDRRLLGIIHHSSLVQVSQEDMSSDVLAMVGASREERALSKPLFAVKKRMPWLQVNLLTAFLAASVVGIFESTIASFTALAVLLPVVAGQSGNAGAQALAVTMRGLALREITVRHWFRVMFKEVRVGLINGIGIAVTCGIGVFVWSQSIGLVLVICSAMVLAMIAAGFAGAVVPIVLVRMGQDPAQASSIILTTVTDIIGFFAFLGIAALLSGLL
ncbi:magnesium transporter [Porticoccus hydrocarbonoclasticus]|uniref:magnesium transporter n=1 Tax=Porticoccus hydrocarbonoclasticus TaxID=1073414 RepID=UPI002356BA96|nr:magnesium transporter [Porticoccus hydrocarbonoclasticus]|tara:strand:- start:16045 stop:17364 length:1320 start_codon:yes stop_codon:yes gene_type:complete